MKTLPKPKSETEYIIVSDKDSKVLKSSTDWNYCVRFANVIREKIEAIIYDSRDTQ